MSKLDIAVIIPARGGSKGIPMKNIQLLNGKPLLAYTIESAINAGVAENVYVSTDSEEIAEIAEGCRAIVINRPAELSHDTAAVESALIHAVETIKADTGMTPEYVLTLQPTSPLRSANTIKRFISYFFSTAGHYDAMFTLTETRGDYWRRDGNGSFKRCFPDAPRRRQGRTPIYLENSAIYITETDALLKTNSILGTACTGFIIDDIEAIDINTPFDFQLAELVLKHICIS